MNRRNVNKPFTMKNEWGLEHSSEVEQVPHTHKALGSIPVTSTEKMQMDSKDTQKCSVSLNLQRETQRRSSHEGLTPGIDEDAEEPELSVNGRSGCSLQHLLGPRAHR